MCLGISTSTAAPYIEICNDSLVATWWRKSPKLDPPAIASQHTAGEHWPTRRDMPYRPTASFRSASNGQGNLPHPGRRRLPLLCTGAIRQLDGRHRRPPKLIHTRLSRSGSFQQVALPTHYIFGDISET